MGQSYVLEEDFFVNVLPKNEIGELTSQVIDKLSNSYELLFLEYSLKSLEQKIKLNNNSSKDSFIALHRTLLKGKVVNLEATFERKGDDVILLCETRDEEFNKDFLEQQRILNQFALYPLGAILSPEDRELKSDAVYWRDFFQKVRGKAYLMYGPGYLINFKK